MAATCFLAACSDESGGVDGEGGGGSSGKAGAGNAGNAGKPSAAGAPSAGATNGGSGGLGEAGETAMGGAETDGGAIGIGGEAGEPSLPSGGTGGSTAGSGGTAGTTAGTGGIAGSGGAPPVAVTNCTRDTTSGKLIALSTTGNDGLFGAAYAPDGTLYATGYVQDGITATADRSTVVVKITAAGVVDTSWATQGLAKVDVVASGTAEMPRGIVVQGGKIVVAGTVEVPVVEQTGVFTADRNVYVLRLNANGTLDTTFGDNGSGIKILDLNKGVQTTNATSGLPQLSAPDAQWGLTLLSDNKLIVTAASRAAGFMADGTTPRSDTDFAVVKLTVDGQLDGTFGTAGKFTLDVAQASASVRTASVLPNGAVIVTGYSTYGGTQRPVIFKLTANGVLDMSFGVFGAFTEPVGTAAEAYGAVLQSTGKLVTVGYGRATAATTATDLLSIRLTANGLLDNTYGTSAGRTWFDVGGYADNGRSLLMLSDDRPVLIGGGRTLADNQDGVITILKADGTPDTTSFGPYGCKAYDFGTISDFLWGSALSPSGNTIAAVGITGNAANSTEDTDGTIVLLAKP